MITREGFQIFIFHAFKIAGYAKHAHLFLKDNHVYMAFIEQPR